MSQQPLAPWQQSLVLGMQRFVYWISKHWLAIANLLIFFFYVFLPFSAPVLMRAGWTGPARAIYTVTKPMCHQLAFRSWFLFGEEPAYSRAEYAERFDLDADSSSWFLEAREFVGNETMGYKVALCQRDVAIYVAFVLGGLVYSLLRRRGVRPMRLWLFILVGVLPMGLDGGTQYIGLLPGIPTRESVWQLRTLTGALFGFSIIWLAFPYIHEGMEETRLLLAQRYGWDGHTSEPEPAPQTTREQVAQLLKDEDVIE